MAIKAAVTFNATAPLTYHDVRRNFTEYALCRDSRCSHKQNPTVRWITISSLTMTILHPLVNTLWHQQVAYLP